MASGNITKLKKVIYTDSHVCANKKKAAEKLKVKKEKRNNLCKYKL